MIVVLYFLFATALAAHATVSVSTPLSDQLPLIARVGSPYAWSFSSDTFVSSKNATLTLTGGLLPVWLSFDSASRTLHGTPAPGDEGAPDVSITATEDGSGDTATSKFSLCVTSSSPPVLNRPVKDQLYPSNPSLSSVFFLSDGSALTSSRPALRIPEGWSFSIGFQYNTFNSNGDLYYAGLQLDGSSLPPWLHFNSREITFNGVTPTSPKNVSQLFSLALHASDQEGYSAGSEAFDIVVSSYELSLSTTSLPTINITAEAPFTVDFSSPADYTGVNVDGNPIQPADVMTLAVDVSQYSSWLRYDEPTRTLIGQPPSDYDGSKPGPVLPVKLDTFFNQSVRTNVSLAVVPSFFSTSSLNPLLIQPGTQFTFDLGPYFSNASSVGSLGSSDVDLSVSFDPPDADEFLDFDSSKAELSGDVPEDESDSDNNMVTVVFTAYSHITHSTSHTSMNISWAPDQYKHEHATPTPGLSNAAHAKLMLALEITFGIIGGVVMVGVLLAGFRQCTKVEDTALVGEEGMRAWSEKDKQWYGVTVEEGSEEGYGWGEGKKGDPGVQQELPDQEKESGATSAPIRAGGYGSLGRTIQRAVSSIKSPTSSRVLSPNWSPRSNVMRKDEFLGKIRATVRQVSGKYRRKEANHGAKPTISKPTLISAPPGVVQANGLPSMHNPFDKANIGIMGYLRNSVMSLGRSPSSSTNATGNLSIPRRRADFVPPGRENTGLPAVPARVHGRRSRKSVRPLHRHTGSVDSVSSEAYEGEAVVQTATKAMSVRTARSVSGISYYSQGAEGSPAVGTRPRLVPFTSVTRVPVPTLPPLSPAPPATRTVTNLTVNSPKRVASQKADVVVSSGTHNNSGSGDDLEIGMQYVNALGEETAGTATPRTSVRDSLSPRRSGSVATGGVSSVFLLESSEQGHRDVVPRMLLRCGELFRFVIPLLGSQANGKVVAQMRDGSGCLAPPFLRYTLKVNGMGKGKEAVEFWGTPGVDDLGEFAVGLYVGAECVGRVDVEVVRRS